MSNDLFAADPAHRPYVPLAERLRRARWPTWSGSRTCWARTSAARGFRIGPAAFHDLLGPPGVGKTTLARLMADGFDAQFIAISAVLGGVKDIRDAVTVAGGAGQAAHHPVRGRGAPLQQGAAGCLPARVESGLFTFIGATTENPVRGQLGLLSRARVYVLQSLTPEELQLLVDRAIAAFNDGLEAGAAMRVEPDAREQLAAWADGDARAG